MWTSPLCPSFFRPFPSFFLQVTLERRRDRQTLNEVKSVDSRPLNQSAARTWLKESSPLPRSPDILVRHWLLCREGSPGQSATGLSGAGHHQSPRLMPCSRSSFLALPSVPYEISHSAQNTQMPLPRKSAFPITRTPGSPFSSSPFSL